MPLGPLQPFMLFLFVWSIKGPRSLRNSSIASKPASLTCGQLKPAAGGQVEFGQADVHISVEKLTWPELLN